MSTFEQVSDNLKEVKTNIAGACQRSSRNVDEVQVIAVTKYASLDTARYAIQSGIEHIGENRWPDAREKWSALNDLCNLHFIGHLQTNKVKDVIGKFSYIHSLDRLSLAKEINKVAGNLGLKVSCFLQVNVSGEESKYGLAPDQLFAFVQKIRDFGNINIAGLMTMAPYESEPERTRPVFRGLRELRDELNGNGLLTYKVEHLSMGMSNDYEVAIEEGATWVRLGSVLVGSEV